jgi:pimeloyl-ACP methyl ester carboxylesterase
MMNTSLYKTPRGADVVREIYEAALKRWPVPHEACMVPTRHGETFVIASGQAQLPVMILLHGAGGNSSMWAGEIALFSSKFRVYALDLPGEAGKSAANRPAWEGPAFAEWLEDVLHELNIEHAVFVGISQGAWAATKFAVRHPECVDALVLMAPGGIVPDRGSFLVRAVVLSLLGSWGVKQLVVALFGDQRVPDGVVEIVTTISQNFKPRIGVLPLFTDDELQHLTMPTLLLGGTKDIMRDLGKIEARLRRFVLQLSSIMIPGAGHALLNTGRPVMDFLISIPETRIDS